VSSLFSFRFLGDVKTAQRIVQHDGAGFEITGATGYFDMDACLKSDINHALAVWYQIRMVGETEWFEPFQLYRALLLKQVKETHLFQWLGKAGLNTITEFDHTIFANRPPLTLSLHLQDGYAPQDVMRFYEVYPLANKLKDWVSLRAWGAGLGIVIEANPFAANADEEAFFITVRDLCRRFPFAVDKMGFRSMRAYLPLAACRVLLRLLNETGAYSVKP